MIRTQSRAAIRTDVRLTRAESKLLARVVETGAGGLETRLGADAARSLLRRDLVVERDGRLWATAEGRARAAREAGGEMGFLAQHRTVERRTFETERGREALLVDLDESPLAWLARRKDRDGKPLLPPAELAAGERLRADFTLGQMTPRITANWEAAIASGRRGGAFGEDPTDATVAARIRVSRALDAVGPELAGALLDVCCFLKGLEEVERERRWPARGAKLVLGLALARLARHYGFVAEGQGPAAGRVLSWGTPDSRPSIDGKPS